MIDKKIPKCIKLKFCRTYDKKNCNSVKIVENYMVEILSDWQVLYDYRNFVWLYRYLEIITKINTKCMKLKFCRTILYEYRT